MGPALGRSGSLVTDATPCPPVATTSNQDPTTAAGADLLGLVLGSVGALGVITELTLRVRPEPRARHYEGWSARSWEVGLAGLQRLAWHGAVARRRPAVRPGRDPR